MPFSLPVRGLSPRGEPSSLSEGESPLGGSSSLPKRLPLSGGMSSLWAGALSLEGGAPSSSVLKASPLVVSLPLSAEVTLSEEVSVLSAGFSSHTAVYSRSPVEPEGIFTTRDGSVSPVPVQPTKV